MMHVYYTKCVLSTGTSKWMNIINLNENFKVVGKKIHLINLAIVNSYIIYKECANTSSPKTQRRFSAISLKSYKRIQVRPMSHHSVALLPKFWSDLLVNISLTNVLKAARHCIVKALFVALPISNTRCQR